MSRKEQSLLLYLLTKLIFLRKMNFTQGKEDDSEKKSDIKSYTNLTTLETLEITMRQLQELEDNFIKLAVRSLMLEVDLATQFGPDLAMTIDKVDQNCQSCLQTLESSSENTR